MQLSRRRTDDNDDVRARVSGHLYPSGDFSSRRGYCDRTTAFPAPFGPRAFTFASTAVVCRRRRMIFSPAPVATRDAHAPHQTSHNCIISVHIRHGLQKVWNQKMRNFISAIFSPRLILAHAANTLFEYDPKHYPSIIIMYLIYVSKKKKLKKYHVIFLRYSWINKRRYQTRIDMF